MKLYELALQPGEAAGSMDYKTLVSERFHLSPSSIQAARLVKRSVDARGRQVKIRLWIEVYDTGESLPVHESLPDYQMVHQAIPVFIIGCGPAGLFAALRLLKHGFKPVIIEQGKDVRSRRRDLAILNKEGMVNPRSNYCFGEGGAGTYSDGKLYTRSTKRGDVNEVLNIFINHGADKDIAIDTHPHIGTNKLPQVITAMHETIVAHGGEIHFNTVLKELDLSHGSLKGIFVQTAENDSTVPVRLDGKAVILATGHSARDIFELLFRQGIKTEAKPLAIGVRVEHPQQVIDAQQYHCDSRGLYLPPASYNLTYQGKERSLYSFCMCPGGIIAPAATAGEEVVVNGWSPSKRNNPFANSGMVVNLGLEDMKNHASGGPLSALRYQQTVERLAWQAGGGRLRAPAQRLVDFTEGKFSASLPTCSYIPGVTSALLEEVLPLEITKTLKEGLSHFGKMMKGYFTNEAILVGVESRTSSPLRIPRNASTLMHEEAEGLFPCGEGAGYAGGIVSAAIDGQRCASACVQYLKQLT